MLILLNVCSLAPSILGHPSEISMKFQRDSLEKKKKYVRLSSLIAFNIQCVER